MKFEEIDKIGTKIDGWLFNNEAKFLYDVANNTKGQIVEIGSFKGKSSVYLAATGNPLTCVDTFKSTNTNAFLEGKNTLEVFEENTKDFTNITKIVGDSVKSAKEFNGNISLLLIDGGHNYEQVISDFNAWEKNLSVGSLILFHDCYDNMGRLYGKNFSVAYPGVQKAVLEICNDRRKEYMLLGGLTSIASVIKIR